MHKTSNTGKNKSNDNNQLKEMHLKAFLEKQQRWNMVDKLSHKCINRQNFKEHPELHINSNRTYSNMK